VTDFEQYISMHPSLPFEQPSSSAQQGAPPIITCLLELILDKPAHPRRHHICHTCVHAAGQSKSVDIYGAGCKYPTHACPHVPMSPRTAPSRHYCRSAHRQRLGHRHAPVHQARSSVEQCSDNNKCGVHSSVEASVSGDVWMYVWARAHCSPALPSRRDDVAIR